MLLLSLFFACELPKEEPQECTDIERVDITDEITLDVAEANQSFGFDIFSQLQDTEDNIFISPYSISNALAMVQLGAEGQTKEEMSTLLGVFDPEADWHQGQGELMQELQLGENCDYQFTVANKVFMKDGYPIEENYLSELSSLYQSEIAILDFESDSEAAREEINTWVSEHTNEKIPELFPSGTITPATAFVLTNAIYLNAPWKQEFDPQNTHSTDFTLADGSKTQVEMMNHYQMSIHISHQEGMTMAKIPYKGDDLSLVIVTPDDPAGLDGILSELNIDTWNSWKSNLYQTEASVGFPKLEMRYKKILNDSLKDMGMPSAFGDANFSGIAPDLAIDTVVHEAWIKISEEGTEAAAATGVSMNETAAMMDELYLNKPFLFAIEDNRSGSLLFIGKITDPSAL
jgi:serpin B